MKVRNDSPFVCIKKEDHEILLEIADTGTLDEVACEIEKMYPTVNFSTASLGRFMRRLKEEYLREDAEDSSEAMEALAKTGADGKSRDGVIEAMRQRMYAAALEAPTSAEAMVVFEKLKAEQKEDRELKLAERRMALEEEKTRQVWRARELEAARSALRLLPRVRELLCEGEGTAEERLARAREVLLVGGAKLLVEGKGARTAD